MDSALIHLKNYRIVHGPHTVAGPSTIGTRDTNRRLRWFRRQMLLFQNFSHELCTTICDLHIYFNGNIPPHTFETFSRWRAARILPWWTGFPKERDRVLSSFVLGDFDTKLLCMARPSSSNPLMSPLSQALNPIQARLFLLLWPGGTLCPPFENNVSLVLTAYYSVFLKACPKLDHMPHFGFHGNCFRIF